MNFAVNRDKGDYKMVLEYKVSAEQALQKLKDGNSEYLSAKTSSGDISLKKREWRYIT